MKLQGLANNEDIEVDNRRQFCAQESVLLLYVLNNTEDKM